MGLLEMNRQLTDFCHLRGSQTFQLNGVQINFKSYCSREFTQVNVTSNWKF